MEQLGQTDSVWQVTKEKCLDFTHIYKAPVVKAIGAGDRFCACDNQARAHPAARCRLRCSVINILIGAILSCK